MGINSILFVFRILLFGICLATPVTAAPLAPSDTADWHEKRHGRLTAREEPLVTRVDQVFARVVSAVDSASSRSFRLLLIKMGSGQLAAAIPDGTVLLTHEALKICYQNVPLEKGDARLAFLLGHELAHHVKNDFWQASAVESMREFVSAGGDALQQVSDYIKQASDMGNTPQAGNVAKSKELQADAYGIVYMAMAGYDPHFVVDVTSTNFIEEFVSRATGKHDFEDSEHPSPEKRAAFLRTQLAAVADEVDLFRIGVRYYQQGRYDEARPFFERFMSRFPSREIFNNLGLTWYQLALERLAKCDTGAAFRFKLPTLLDTETRAFATRGESRASVCLNNADYRREIGEAVKYLELSRAKDPFYLPSRINLVSALLMSGSATAALAAADDALKVTPGSLDVMAIRAVALYQAATEMGLEAADRALTLLSPLSSNDSPRSDVLYNMGTIALERKLTVAARSNLEAFLTVEKTGPYADLAAQKLGKPVPSGIKAPHPSLQKSPVPTGDLQSATFKALQVMTKRKLMVGADRVTIYRDVSSMVLVVDDNGQDVVDVVESVLLAPMPLATFQSANGLPRRVIVTPSGETLVYNNVSADVLFGQIRTLVFFAPKRWL